MISIIKKNQPLSMEKINAFLLSIYVVFLTSHNLFHSFSAGDFLFGGISFLLLFRNRKNKLFIPLFFFFFYVTFQTLILLIREPLYITVQGTINKYLKWTLMMLIVIIMPSNIDNIKFYKLYSLLGKICIIAIFIQSIEVYILHKNMTVLVPFAEFCAKDKTLLYGSNRPCAFFLEPQHFASFICPLLILKLKEKRIIYSIIISLSIFLSSSSQGIVICAAIWGIYIIMDKSISNRQKIIYASLTIGLLILFITSPLFIRALDKILNISITNDIRISKAFLIYFKMPVIDKIMGIGMKNVNNYIFVTGYASNWLMSETSPAKDFLSSLGGNFVEFGLIGGILFIYLLISMYKGSGPTGKKLTLMIGLSALSQTLVFNSWFVFFWILYFICIDEHNVDKMLKGSNINEKNWNFNFSLCR